jgi:hypothetical protein
MQFSAQNGPSANKRIVNARLGFQKRHERSDQIQSAHKFKKNLRNTSTILSDIFIGSALAGSGIAYFSQFRVRPEENVGTAPLFERLHMKVIRPIAA